VGNDLAFPLTGVQEFPLTSRTVHKNSGQGDVTNSLCATCPHWKNPNELDFYQRLCLLVNHTSLRQGKALELREGDLIRGNSDSAPDYGKTRNKALIIWLA